MKPNLKTLAYLDVHISYYMLTPENPTIHGQVESILFHRMCQ